MQDETALNDSFLEDPIEPDSAFAEIIADADAEAEADAEEERELRGMGIEGLGACHYRCGVKKRFLKEKSGVDWKWPDEVNLGVCFD